MEQSGSERQLEERQKELERKGIEKGVEHYRKLKEEAKASELKPGELLMVNLLGPLTEAIEKEQETLRSAKSDRGRPKKYGDLMLALAAEKLALITVRQALNACADVDTSRITNVAQKIADLVKMELSFELVVKNIQEEKKKSRIKRIKGSKNQQKAITDIKKEFKLTETRWGPGTREHLGLRLLDLLTDSTSAFEIATQYEGIKTVTVLKMSDETIKFLEEQHAICEELARPLYGPMICPPKPWQSLDEGGYLDIRIDMVKNLKERHREILEKENLEKVYKALNLIQATPWRINRKIYRLMKKCWESNQPLGDLPPKDDPSFPSKPPDYETNEASRKEWGWKAKEVYEQKAIFRSQRLQLREKLTLAKEYVNEPKIYFPHNLDFRGRVYPIPQHLNPQGDDTSKALLEFAEGKPLGEKGGYWLGIHLANLFGKDKLSFEDRQKWIRANEDAIIDSAMSIQRENVTLDAK